jgi:large subunit ribosomal protein L21
MYAVVKTGGKQYRVQSGEELNIERLAVEVGSEVVFDEVLLVGGDDEVVVGRPLVEGAKVTAKVVRQDRARKIIIFKHRRRGGFRKKRGHRQSYTRVRITDINR